MSSFSIGRNRAGGGGGRSNPLRTGLPVLRGIVDQTIVFRMVCFNMKQYRSTFICIAWVMVVYIVHPFSISAQYM